MKLLQSRWRVNRQMIAASGKRPASPGSTFGERFVFGRLWQSIHSVLESDDDFAKGVELSPGSISAYRKRDEAPPMASVRPVAERLGVDAGWLAAGGEAGQPEGFADWLQRQRDALKARAKYKTATDAAVHRKKGRG